VLTLFRVGGNDVVGVMIVDKTGEVIGGNFHFNTESANKNQQEGI